MIKQSLKNLKKSAQTRKKTLLELYLCCNFEAVLVKLFVVTVEASRNGSSSKQHTIHRQEVLEIG
jgi:hypothetical protein